MKIGTIVKNNWAGEGNPHRYLIYTGMEGRYATGLSINNGRLEKVKYYSKDFKDRVTFEPVGYCDGFDRMKNDLKSLLK